MTTTSELSFHSHANVFDRALSLEAVRSRAPAVFATAAADRLSAKYAFIPTAQVLSGLMSAGFLPVEARQASSRRANPLHARHVIRLRRRYETVSLKDTSNGLIVSRAAFPGYCVSHRGNVLDEVIAGALKVAERFESLAVQVERMEQRRLLKDEQLAFAERALALRFPDPAQSGMEPLQLLSCRRPEDVGDDLWRVYNRCQEHLLRGGLSRRSATGRLTRTRGISSIRRDVQLNGQLWDLAAQVLAA
ncbi:MAG: DUF945 domain-containing protein [Gammaproteobacteria bacterium]|nr:MAG: DUF945 domain-containing protein [Gammaproteobacteria bacterium]